MVTPDWVDQAKLSAPTIVRLCECCQFLKGSNFAYGSNSNKRLDIFNLIRLNYLVFGYLIWFK